MSDDHVVLSRDACHAVTDAVQRAIVDRRASHATRRAALSALLGLIDAGVVVGTPQHEAPDPGRAPAGVMRPAAGRVGHRHRTQVVPDARRRTFWEGGLLARIRSPFGRAP